MRFSSIEEQFCLTVVCKMIEVKQKRPDGLTAIAILWFVGALLNVLNSFLVLSQGAAALPYLSNSGLHEWFSFGVPIEIVLSGLVLALGLVQIVTVFGLWTGKKYSYKLSLAVPVVHVVLSVCFVVLYATAPAELGLISSVGSSVFGLAVGLAFLVVIWWYLRKPHVKAFLVVAEAEKPPSLPSSPGPAFREVSEQPREEVAQAEKSADAEEGVEARLDALRKLRDHNYISEEEYERKRAELLAKI